MNNIETKVIQFLRQQAVSFDILPHQRPAITIVDAAQQRGVRPAQMVKCILLRDMSDRYALACVPGDRAVDPKKVRQLLHWRRMTCVSADAIPAITGYEPGTVTPLMLITPMPVFFDRQLSQEPEITISSGSRMAGIKMHLDDLINLVKPIVGDISRD